VEAKPPVNRLDRIERAKTAFIRAAAALTEAPTVEALAFALQEGALGLLHVGEADADGTARDLVLASIASIRKGGEDTRL
jgi:hypothetical protein